jgi:hypothetical protein
MRNQGPLSDHHIMKRRNFRKSARSLSGPAWLCALFWLSPIVVRDSTYVSLAIRVLLDVHANGARAAIWATGNRSIVIPKFWRHVQLPSMRDPIYGEGFGAKYGAIPVPFSRLNLSVHRRGRDNMGHMLFSVDKLQGSMCAMSSAGRNPRVAVLPRSPLSAVIATALSRRSVLPSL